MSSGNPLHKTPAARDEPSVLREFWDFMRVRKKWWLTPVVLLLALLAALIVIAQGTKVAPFLYTLF